MPAPASAFALLLVRCSDRSARAEWERWWDERHVPDLLSVTGGAWVDRWVLAADAPVGHTGFGFTDAAFVGLVPSADGAAPDPADAVDGLARAWPELWAEGRVHERHVLAGAEAFVGHGPSGSLAPATTAATGRILAHVLCTDPGRRSAWDRWYEEQHLPDMMATGAFGAGSRWRRARPPVLGAAHATIYDVVGRPLDEAVAVSAAAMPGLAAAGRKPGWHAGGLTLTLVPPAISG